jgi:hypothetical protein
MPITIALQPNQRIVLINISTPVTGLELSKIYAQVEELRNQSPYPLHCLVDTTKVRGVPPDLFLARTSVRWELIGNTHTVIVVKNAGFRILADTFFRFARFDRATIVQTVKEGQEFLDRAIQEEAHS